MVLLPYVFALLAAPAAPGAFHEALLGTPERASAETLLAQPGRYVGRAVRTRGRLARGEGRDALVMAAGRGTIALRLEPEAIASTAGALASWLGHEVEADGLFYREPDEGGPGGHALRVFRLARAGVPAAVALPSPEPVVSLESLVYGDGRYDGQVVRVRGVDRGSNRHRDLPDATRRSATDWVLKDGFFAVWVGGREGLGGETDVPVEVVGVPTTSRGVVRIAARRVAASADGAAAMSRALTTGDAGLARVPPRLSFAYPVGGATLGPRGHLILQFSKPMDPSRFAQGVRVRYEGVAAAPDLSFDYRDRNRALVVTPAPPPPPGATVVVELLADLVDVDGRGLVPTERAPGGGAVVESIRFRAGS